MLGRIIFRLDGRTAMAAWGTAAALLLPAAGVLVLAGLEDEQAPASWLVHREGPFALADLPLPPDAAAARWNGSWTAVVVGDPIVRPHQLGVMPGAPSPPATPGLDPRPIRSARELIPMDAWLVHPEHAPPQNVIVARYDERPDERFAAAGFVVLPGDGRHGFAEGSLRELQAGAWGFMIASLPAVAILGAAFASVESRRLRRTRQTLSALGAPASGRSLVLFRVLWMQSLALAAALVVLGVVIGFGGPVFHPRPLPIAALALAVLVPWITGTIVGVLAAWRRVGLAGLTAGADAQVPGPMLRVSPLWQPLLVGWRITPVLFVAALLLVVDSGFPLAAMEVPVAVSARHDEVVSTEGANVLDGRAEAARATVALADARVQRAIAEVLIPTTLGDPVLLRAGDWEAGADYHGLRIVAGRAPVAGELVLGDRLAQRSGLAIGETVWVPASDRPHVRPLEVVGRFTGPDLLRDEAWTTLADGQDLAGLAPHEATVVRARPATQGVLAVLSQEAPRIEVTDLRWHPVVPAAGQLVAVEVDLVNLGSKAGSRQVEVRVDEIVAAQATVKVPGLSTTTSSLVFIAPEGPFRLAVNPEAAVDAGPGGHLAVPPAFAGTPFTVTTDPETRVHVYRSAADALARGDPVQAVRSDAQGEAVLELPQGRFVIVADTDPQAAAPLQVAAAEDALGATLQLEGMRVEPVRPRAGEAVLLHLLVRNLGGQEANTTVDVMVEDAVVARIPVRLAPGASTWLQGTLPSFADGTYRVEVLGTSTRLGSPPARGGGQAPAAEGVRTGDGLALAAADDLLGDARRAMVALTGSALTTSLVILFLATERAVQERQGTLGALWALGLRPQRIIARAAWEGGVLVGAVTLLAVAVLRLLFLALGAAGWPTAFGHGLPDPVDLTFTTQIVSAGAVAGAVAAAWATRSGLRSLGIAT